jgi:hypothetical protein
MAEFIALREIFGLLPALLISRGAGGNEMIR